MKISPIISVKELKEIYQHDDVIVFDARNNAHAKEAYDKEHIDGALFIDVNSDLASIQSDVAHGGRHPLPNPQEFTQTLTMLGVLKSHHIIIYDDSNGANAAARFWWMLKSAGHDRVQVLDGGLQEAIRQGFPVNSNPVSNRQAVESYPATDWTLPLAWIDEVEAKASRSDCLIIDVRSAERYQGKKEPIDLIAGHIPGAVNIPFTENLNGDGLFINPEEIQKKYGEIFETTNPGNIIVHCGSGVTACHTLLALSYANLPNPKLYVGSWSEWSRNGKPMASDEG